MFAHAARGAGARGEEPTGTATPNLPERMAEAEEPNTEREWPELGQVRSPWRDADCARAIPRHYVDAARVEVEMPIAATTLTPTAHMVSKK